MNRATLLLRSATAPSLAGISLVVAFFACSFGSAGTAWAEEVGFKFDSVTDQSYATADAVYGTGVPPYGATDNESQSGLASVSVDATAGGLSSHGEAQENWSLFGEGTQGAAYYILTNLNLYGHAAASGIVAPYELGRAIGSGEASFSASQSFVPSGSWISGRGTLTRNDQNPGGPLVTFSLTGANSFSSSLSGNGTQTFQFARQISGSFSIYANAVDTQPLSPFTQQYGPEPGDSTYSTPASYASSGVASYAIQLFVLPGNGDGSDQYHPIVPLGNNGSAYTFSDTSASIGKWYDPLLAYGYDYQTTDSISKFTQVGLPVGNNDGPYTISGDFGDGGAFDTVLLAGGSFFSFPDPVSEFTIAGIDPLVDPNDPGSFSTFLAFDHDTASFSMTPLEQFVAVPEPGGLLLAALGAAGLALGKAKWKAKWVRTIFRLQQTIAEKSARPIFPHCAD